jgi:TatD DNase family protein
MVFNQHFDLSAEFGLPMIFHARDAETDFVDIIRANRDKFTSGIVRDFEGSV